MSEPFFGISRGVLISLGDQQYEVTDVLSSNSALARNIETGSLERVKLDSARPGQNNPKQTVSKKDLSEFSEAEWEKARHRYETIKPLLGGHHVSRKEVAEVAEAAGCSPATIYRWRDAYQCGGDLSSLIPSKRGRKKGSTFLSPQQERIVGSTIEDVYLSPQKHTAQDVVDEIHHLCRQVGLKPPCSNTVRGRIRRLRPRKVHERRGESDVARNRFEPIRGQFPGAEHPLAVVQIDHTEADVILVEESTRLPVGRPWLTLAIDVFSRMIAGLYISLEPPSAISVGMCLAGAIIPKSEYLATLDIPGEWPVWGKMGRVHADNAKEFRGAMLLRACQQYGIDLQMRPIKVPHYGGHIERLMGTVANEIRKLPGATFSSPSERKGYNSDAHAALTLKEFEQRLVDFIVNVYHKRLHSELGVPPLRKWEVGTVGDGVLPGPGVPAMPADPTRIRLDFMPFVERTVQPYGLLIDDIGYYSEVLNPWINASADSRGGEKRRFIARRDPRDISRVYFYDPEAGEYYMIPYRNAQHPPMSLWELREVRKALREEGARHVDETAIFEALKRMRQRTEDAKRRSKSARRKLSRIPKYNNAQTNDPIPRISMEPPLSPGSPAEDPFAGPIRPFEDLEIER